MHCNKSKGNTMNTFNASTAALTGSPMTAGWWSLLQRAWAIRLADVEQARPAVSAAEPDEVTRLEAGERLRERIRAYEGTQPSYAADLQAALAQLEREPGTR